MFEQASREKLRYKVGNGVITTEDLWEVPLTTLDTLAKSLKKELEDTGESFITTRTTANKTIELKFEVVKHVIKVRLEELDKKKQQAEKKKKREQILELIGRKEEEGLAAKSIDDLKKELAELD